MKLRESQADFKDTLLEVKESMATKDDISRLETTMATKQDIKDMATKADISRLETMMQAILERLPEKS